MKAPLPENEAERLAALHGLAVLDTPPEPAFDDLSTLAGTICQTPIALISLVDAHRQWFKSRVGWTVGETPREVAFCAHTILQPDLMVVPDASTDERFANNPLVTSPPRIRFYAGASLVTAEGHALGTICVMDHKPRELTAAQAQALRALSHQVVAQLHLQKQLAERTRQGAELARVNEVLQAEVEERRRVEQELRQTRERFELAVRGSQDGLWDWNLETNEVYYSPRWKGILGYEDHEIAGRLEEWSDRLHPDERDEVLAANYAHITGATPHYEREFRLRHKDGSYRWILSRGVALRDGRGRAYRMAGSHADITERKRAEEELCRANERLALAIRGSNVGIWENDMAGGDYRAGRVHCTNIREQLGYSAPESALDYETVVAPIHPEDRGPMEQALRAYLAGDTPEYSVEFRARHRDGSYRWMLSRGVAVRDAAGQPVRFVGTRIDITERKSAEDALRDSEARFRGTFENAGVGIAHADFDGRWLRLNEKLCAIVGYTREELLHRTFRDITYPDDLPVSLDQLGRLLRGETPSYTLEKRYVRKDGSPVWIDLAVSVQRDAAGTPAYLIAIIQDISERKWLEGELRQAIARAEAASRAKSEFLAHVSHEVRTPLNAILGMNELALDTPLTEQQRKYLTVERSSAEALLGVIDDLLDFSKIEAGKLELDRAAFALRAALNDTLRPLALRAHRKRLEMVCRVRPDVPDALVGDAGRLRQVLTNLVGNAIKFTEHGEVVVEVEMLEPEGGLDAGCAPELSGQEAALTSPERQRRDGSVAGAPGLWLLFSVRDTGIGIPRDKQERIFQPFEQADSSTTRRYGGTGLGLSIASQLVGLMGGRITAESEPGRGSTFLFTVCVECCPRQPDRVALRVPAELHGLPVLIVDDNAASRRTLEEWLRGWRTEPTAVGDSSAALEALRHAAAGRPFALVVLDSRLPGSDALAVAARVKETPELSATRILLLTVEDDAREVSRSDELGIAACVMKPVQEEELLDAVCRARSLPSPVAPVPAVGAPSGDRAPTGVTAAAGPGAPMAGVAMSDRRLHVLLAEDNPYNQAVMQDLLERRGHALHTASDGQAALAALERDRFDVMLLDIHMPELDGFAVIAALRQREQGSGGHLPVIALTARCASGERERCLQAGMDEYLAKPIRAAELFAAIDRVVFGEEDPWRAERGADVPAGLLDPAALLAACDGDAELLRKMCRHFQDHVPGRLDEVGEALRDRDAPRLREAAHRLGGMVSSFSAAAAAAVALLERLGAQGELEKVIPIHSRLTEIVGSLCSELDSLSVEQLQRRRRDVREATNRR
jgi:PAS domain S-box-containing protein